MSKNFYTDNLDVAFHLKKRINLNYLLSLMSEKEKEPVSNQGDAEYIDNVFQILESFGEICALVSLDADKLEKEGVKLVNGIEQFSPTLLKNIKKMIEFNLQALCSPSEFGGYGAPFAVEMIGGEMMNRACPSTAMTMNWYASIARIIEKYGSEELKQEYIPAIIEGKYSGYMALTEPDAGSDLSALKSYAEKQEDGSYKLYGTKRFISNGTAHIGLVLSRTSKEQSGLKHLSLFLCPRTWQDKENVKVLKLEEKMGIHASATAELAYDGSRAWLLGKEDEGFHYMLDLMNESRIAVSFQSIGLMEATWRLAKQYAEERQTWGKPIIQHELIAEKILDMEVELKALRSLSCQTAYLSSLKEILQRRIKKNEIPAHSSKEKLEKELGLTSKKLRAWTPLIKYWGAEKAVEHARTCMQIHGGYGYIKEYKAEWWMRESLIYSIYEGTSQIQALMCTKDLLKHIVRNPKKFLEETLTLRVKGFAESDPLKRKFYKIKQVSNSAILSVLLRLIKSNSLNKKPSLNTNPKVILEAIRKMGKRLMEFNNLQVALLHAERLCEIKCYEALAQCVIEDYAVDPDRRWIAEHFLHKALPQVVKLKSMIDEDSRVLIDRLASYQTADQGLSS
ncbi:MAG: acyl-CoA dehydrogenase family protein [Oligoflexales bacterium]|nr:acyl-CoA dehydrogenase family protein [Oligoflexales bacterium]